MTKKKEKQWAGSRANSVAGPAVDFGSRKRHRACISWISRRMARGPTAATSVVKESFRHGRHREPYPSPSNDPPIQVFFPTRLHLLHNPCPAQRCLIVVSSTSSKTDPSLISSEPPEVREVRLETEAALEWGGVCTRLADFAATTSGRAACGER
jgi:hypothetical protein